MSGQGVRPAPALRLVHSVDEAPGDWTWFCGHCAAPSPNDEPPPPTARVCSSCGFGLMLEVRADAVPGPRDAFLVVDSALLVQAMSRQAEQLLGMTEDEAVNRPVGELLVTADTEARGQSFAGAIADAVAGSDDPMHAYVRPWNTFGVRMRAKIASCGPPRAALLVLDSGPPPGLRAVPASGSASAARPGA